MLIKSVPVSPCLFYANLWKLIIYYVILLWYLLHHVLFWTISYIKCVIVLKTWLISITIVYYVIGDYREHTRSAVMNSFDKIDKSYCQPEALLYSVGYLECLLYYEFLSSFPYTFHLIRKTFSEYLIFVHTTYAHNGN